MGTWDTSGEGDGSKTIPEDVWMRFLARMSSSSVSRPNRGRKPLDCPKTRGVGEWARYCRAWKSKRKFAQYAVQGVGQGFADN